MGYTVDCCHSYQDFSFHHGKDVLDTKHINKLFKINNYNDYLKISKEYDILFCIDIIDATPGQIQVGYQNFKNNIKTIYLIGDLFIHQKPCEHIYYKMEHEVLNNINPYLIVFSGQFLKKRTVNLINKIKYSTVILNSPLFEDIELNSSKNVKYNNGDNIKIVLISSITDKIGHFYNYIDVLKKLTMDERIHIDIYTPVSNLKYKDVYNIKNVNIKETIPISNVNNTLRKYHIGLLYYNDNIDKKYLLQIDLTEPNKLYDYYFAELPILSTVHSKSLQDIINEKKLGITIDLNNETNLYSKLSSLIKNYKHNNTVYQSFDDQKSQKIINTLIRRY